MLNFESLKDFIEVLEKINLLVSSECYSEDGNAIHTNIDWYHYMENGYESRNFTIWKPNSGNQICINFHYIDNENKIIKKHANLWNCDINKWFMGLNTDDSYYPKLEIDNIFIDNDEIQKLLSWFYSHADSRSNELNNLYKYYQNILNAELE